MTPRTRKELHQAIAVALLLAFVLFGMAFFVRAWMG